MTSKALYERFRRPRAAVAVMAIFAFTLAACGDDSDPDVGQAVTTTPSPDAPPTPEAGGPTASSSV